MGKSILGVVDDHSSYGREAVDDIILFSRARIEIRDVFERLDSSSRAERSGPDRFVTDCHQAGYKDDGDELHVESLDSSYLVCDLENCRLVQLEMREIYCIEMKRLVPSAQKVNR